MASPSGHSETGMDRSLDDDMREEDVGLDSISDWNGSRRDYMV